MFQSMQTRTAMLLLLSALLFIPSLSAQSKNPPVADRAPAARTIEAVDELLASYNVRFDAVDRMARDSRQQIDSLSEELMEEMNQLFPPTLSNETLMKSQKDCELSCGYARSARKNADMTKFFANAAAASSDPDCDNSYTYQAQSHAAIAYAYANWAVPFACQGPSGSAQAIGLLGSAISRAQLVNTNAISSNQAGCAESYDTALYASYTADDLHNARFYAYSCN